MSFYSFQFLFLLFSCSVSSPHHFLSQAPPISIPMTTVVHATNPKFAETPLGNQSLPSSPAQTAPPVIATKAWSDNGQYSDVTGPLPGFLRNEEMLVSPEATPELIAAAQLNDECEKKESETKEVPIKNTPTKKGRGSTSEDYIDPRDAKSPASAMRHHEKIKNKISQGLQEKRASGEPKCPAPIVADDGNYSIVSDALPKGDFERVEMGSRSRAYSDDVIKGCHSNQPDSGKGSNKDSAESGSPELQKRFHSMKEKPKHTSPVAHKLASEAKSQPITRRRSMAQHKEQVSFDPKTAGFKLSAKRTSSDGSPSLTQRKEGQASPVSDPGRVLPGEGGVTDEGFIEGGVHMYAAVDLKAKCRPEDDIMRREGVGVPEHYNAPVTCN